MSQRLFLPRHRFSTGPTLQSYGQNCVKLVHFTSIIFAGLSTVISQNLLTLSMIYSRQLSLYLLFCYLFSVLFSALILQFVMAAILCIFSQLCFCHSLFLTLFFSQHSAIIMIEFSNLYCMLIEQWLCLLGKKQAFTPFFPVHFAIPLFSGNFMFLNDYRYILCLKLLLGPFCLALTTTYITGSSHSHPQ